MTDPISVATFALSLTTKATDALNALRERAQRSKDLDIKDQISTLYDIVLQLKEVISRLSDENKDLKQHLEAQKQSADKPKIRQVAVPRRLRLSKTPLSRPPPLFFSSAIRTLT